MAASNEWDEWHLTEHGWVQGTEKTDFERNFIEPPKDRVATYKYQEYVGSVHSKMEISWGETWIKSGFDVSPLLDKYGKYPSTFIEDRVNGKPINICNTNQL